ncbi:hypothetical protein L6452_27557 [Arctium lappa]|uniref:Uncharacterized protein n=1 Tax=Arctium lappa TaxID=4217 RepID=A0ACB8ZXC0_ARCLA|nr:hypothetical protein L6452_27557 [Arctium lappa]
MTITKSKPRKRSHVEMKGVEFSSENNPNKQSTPSKKIAKEKQPPTKRYSAIALSEDSREKNSKEVDSEVVVSKLSTTALDALAAVAGTQVQMPEATTVQTTIIPTEATSVLVNPFSNRSTLRASVDKAFAAMDELLGRRSIQTTTVNTTITTLDTTPVIPENPIPKPTENPSIEAPIIPETPIHTPLATPITTPLNSPLITPVATPKVTKTPPLVSPSKIPDDTLSELLGINLTPKHQEKQSVNPMPPPTINLWMCQHSPSMSHVSPVHTATTPPIAGDAQDGDGEVDMTRVKRRTVYKKKLKDKKKKRSAKEVEVAEDTEVEDISPPKRIKRQEVQSMAQAKGSNKAVL